MTTNEQVQMRTCPLCEGMRGIEVRVQDGQVLSVRPDRDNVFSRGHMCPKGTTMGALHHDPDRLRGPVIKKNGTWHEVGWEEALRHCERIAHPVIKQYGSQALAAYTGNMIAKSFDLVRYVRSEEHTSELQSLMRNSYAVFCLKKKKDSITRT